MIKISVVIPVYNREGKIEKAIDSVLTQEGDGELFEISEIIVVDDCSTDKTFDVVKKICDKNPKVVCVRLDENGGPGRARNAGTQIAKTEWIAFQDSDDLWHKDKLKVIAKHIEKNAGADLYTHFYEATTSDKENIIVSTEEKDSYFEELSIHNFLGAPAIVVKKEVFESVGGFDEKMRALEDWDFALRFSYDHKIFVVPEVLLNVDLTGHGVSSDIANYYEARCYLIAKNKTKLLQRGTFNGAVESLLNSAQNRGVLQNVSKILETYLKVEL